MKTAGSDYGKRLLRAFPSIVSHDVQKVLKQIKCDSEDQISEPYHVEIGIERLDIPQRVYFENVSILSRSQLSKKEKNILDCIYSRHHDGRIREKALRKIILVDEEWVAPFVLKLVGEYVIEILDLIYENLLKVNKSTYKDFILKKP